MELLPQIRDPEPQPNGRSPLRDLGATAAGLALRPLAAGVAVGRRTERELRSAALGAAESATLAAVDALLASRLADEVVERVLASPLAHQTIERALAGPLVEEAVERLLQTEELWLLVDEIARSPAVAEAIQRQSVGFADEVAGGMRARSRRIDDRLETGARRLFRRKPRAPEAPGSAGE